jgi:hypothetical protein
MSENTPDTPPGMPDEHGDAGEPIGTLWHLEQNPGSTFLQGIRKRILRRTGASQLISASWHLPGVVFAGLVGMLVYMLGGAATKNKN